jgi:hypothetical protein
MGALLSLFLSRPPPVQEPIHRPAIVWTAAYENDEYDYRLDTDVYITNADEIYLDIKGIDKIELVYALWCNATRVPVIMTANVIPPSFNVDSIKRILESESPIFDYLNGSAIKSRIQGDTIDPYRYDHYHGLGKCARVIDFIRGNMEGKITHNTFEFYKSKLRKIPKFIS